MMSRPKRMVNKPSRYLTTSSDESPKRQRTSQETIVSGTLDDDFHDIDMTLNQQDSLLQLNRNEICTQAQNTPRNIQQTYDRNIQPSTQLYTNIEPYTSIRPHTTTFPCTSDILPQMHTYSHTPSNVLSERYPQNRHGFTMDIQSDKTVYTNSTLGEFQNNAHHQPEQYWKHSNQNDYRQVEIPLRSNNTMKRYMYKIAIVFGE